VVRYWPSRRPSRYWIAWKTGAACGLTLTLSARSRWAMYSVVMIRARLALLA
jgi:hypothetical protein